MQAGKARHVLVICYDFPAIHAAGVIRTYQLAKVLPGFGWQPVILAGQACDNNREVNIETSDGDLPCPKITVAGPRFFVPSRSDSDAPLQPVGPMAPRVDGRLRRLLLGVKQLAVPDGKIAWLLPAVKRCHQMAREYPLQLCFSVSPRPTSHLVAYCVARSLNIPWVADFALPWSRAHWLTARPRCVAWLDQELEGLVVRAAQRITVAYADIARTVGARCGSAYEGKMAVVPTGFAEDLFTDQTPSLPSEFTVLYPGNHFCEDGRDGEYFLKAIDEWLDLEPEVAQKLKVVFMGKRDDGLLRHWALMRHPEVLRVLPPASHRGCIQAIQSSHVCVVNTVGNRIPAKLYECMRAAKWILALAKPDSDLAHMLRRYAKGIVIPPRDGSGIRQTLQEVAGSRRCAGLTEAMSAGTPLPQYSSRQSAASLAGIFDDVWRSWAPSYPPHKG